MAQVGRPRRGWLQAGVRRGLPMSRTPPVPPPSSSSVSLTPGRPCCPGEEAGPQKDQAYVPLPRNPERGETLRTLPCLAGPAW